MKSVNRVVLLGNMGNSPEFRTFPSGDRVAHFSVCTTEKWKDRGSGELKERSEWNKVQVRDKSTVDYLEERFVLERSLRPMVAMIGGSLKLMQLS